MDRRQTSRENIMTAVIEQRSTSERHQTGGAVFIAGGTGKTGRRVAERLEALGVPVRIGSRSSEPPFDWEKPDNWSEALAGSSAIYAAFAPDVAMPGAIPAIERLIETAKQAGIDRLVFLSGRGEPEAREAELVVEGSGLRWTIVRCAWFMQNFSENFWIEGVLSGEIMLPIGGDVGEPFLDANDIADVVVAALTDSGHDGKLYELTGPRTLTMPEVARELSTATSREIRFEPIGAEAYSTGMRAEGVPEPVIELVDYLFSTVMDGRNAWLADGVQRALGRAPRDFRDYALAAAASGVWDPPVDG
jgi:uncharacterized protein YbjT (DUF2867 family)